MPMSITGSLIFGSFSFLLSLKICDIATQEKYLASMLACLATEPFSPVLIGFPISSPVCPVEEIIVKKGRHSNHEETKGIAKCTRGQFHRNSLEMDPGFPSLWRRGVVEAVLGSRAIPCPSRLRHHTSERPDRPDGLFLRSFQRRGEADETSTRSDTAHLCAMRCVGVVAWTSGS